MKNILIKTLSRLLKCHCRQKWSDCPFCFLSTKIQIKAFERKQNPKQDVTTAQKSRLKTPGFTHRWILTCTWGWWPTLTGWWQLLLPPNRSEQPMGQQAAESCCRTEPIPGPLAGFPWKPNRRHADREWKRLSVRMSKPLALVYQPSWKKP